MLIPWDFKRIETNLLLIVLVRRTHCNNFFLACSLYVTPSLLSSNCETITHNDIAFIPKQRYNSLHNIIAFMTQTQCFYRPIAMLLPTERNAFTFRLHNNIFVSGEYRKKRRLIFFKSRILFNIERQIEVALKTPRKTL